MNPVNKLKSSYVSYRLNKIKKLETTINTMGNIKAAKSSPDRLMPDKLKITIKTLPNQLSIASNMEKTVKSMHKNPKNPKTVADEEFIKKFEKYSQKLGIASIGYVNVPSYLIFNERSIITDHAIVLTLEMDEDIISNLPSQENQDMAFQTIDELGKITNKLADYMRKNGFTVQASHPAGGFVIYPWIAQIAGLGFTGRHGLLITPEFGPRQRISALFTSITNLPNNKDDHSWISDFCASCGRCVIKCPEKAIREYPIKHEDGRLSHLNNEKCVGCTICIKECTFNKKDYYKVKEIFEKN